MVSDSISICFCLPPPISEWLHSEEFGTEKRQTTLLSEGLANRGHDVTIIANAPVDIPERNDIQCIEVPPVTGSSISPITRSGSYIQALDEADADVYYLRGASETLPLIWQYTQLEDRHYVFHATDDSHIFTDKLHNEPLGEQESELLASAVMDADAIIAQTKQQRTQLQNLYGRHVTIIPNGYEMQNNDPVTELNEREYFLWVDHITEERQPSQLLEVAERLPEHQFRMFGPVRADNEFHADIKTRANQRENVTFTGFVPVSDLSELYRNAIAVVNTAEELGFPTRVLEAWRHGTPTVALHDVLDESIATGGHHIVSEDRDSMVTDLQHLAEDTSLHEDLSRSARKSVETNYSCEPVISACEAVLCEVIDETGGTPRKYQT